MYQSSHFHKGTQLAMSLIADTVLNPAFLPEELDAQREAARYELREVSAKPEMILPEILHEVAYDNKGLGNSLLCPEHRIDVISKSMMEKYMKKWYRPDRMVIAGAGMQHAELVEYVDRHFSHLRGPAPVASTGFADVTQSTDGQKGSASSRQSQQVSPHLLKSSQSPSPSLYKSLTRAASSYLNYPPLPKQDDPVEGSTYTGGHRFIHDPTTEFNHVYLAFEGVGIHDDDVYAVATMQVLLGGGGSFSAGVYIS